jgi:hypothetical protein
MPRTILKRRKLNGKKKRAANAKRQGETISKLVNEINTNIKLRAEIIEAFEREGRPLTRQALDQWRSYSKGVPADRVLTVARVMGIDPYQLRPDIFPRPS